MFYYFMCLETIKKRKTMMNNYHFNYYNALFICFIVLLSQYAIVNGEDVTYYCSDKPTVVELNIGDTASIITRNRGQSAYGDLKSCEWQIETSAEYRIQISDINVNLPYIHDYSNCATSDYVEFLSNEQTLFSLCRNEGYRHIISIDNKLTVKFKSDNLQNAKGVEFKVTVWDPKVSCPNGWYKLDDECYVLYGDNVQKTANIAQSYCNVAQSNLASFITKSHLDSFISDYLLAENNNFNSEQFWIGLTDRNGKLNWLEDDKTLDYNVEIHDEDTSDNRYCFKLRLNKKSSNNNTSAYKFVRMACDTKTLKYSFACKMHQKNATNIYTLPTDKSFKDEKENWFNIFLKIGFPIVAILIGICILLLVCYSSHLENKCGEKNLLAAKLSTIVVVFILIIAFITLFVAGILTRSRLVMAVGIPVMILIFFAIILIIYLNVKSCKNSKGGDAQNENELEGLRNQDNNVGITTQNSLPTYDQVSKDAKP